MTIAIIITVKLKHFIERLIDCKIFCLPVITPCCGILCNTGCCHADYAVLVCYIVRLRLCTVRISGWKQTKEGCLGINITSVSIIPSKMYLEPL